jgi:hypothetical protein
VALQKKAPTQEIKTSITGCVGKGVLRGLPLILSKYLVNVVNLAFPGIRFSTAMKVTLPPMTTDVIMNIS